MFVYNGEQVKSHSFLLNSVFVFFFKLSPWIFNHWVPVISFNSWWMLVSSLEASSTLQITWKMNCDFTMKTERVINIKEGKRK